MIVAVIRSDIRPLLLSLAAIAFLFVVTLALFSPVRNHALLQWDDQLHLTENPYIQPGDADRYAYFWRQSYAKLYVPITYNVWAAIYAECFDAQSVFSPRLLHVANIIAHGIAVVFVFLLLFRLLKPADETRSSTRVTIAAFCGATLFAWHPLQVEAVAWISELRGLLAADFALAAMLVYLLGASAAQRVWRIAWFAASTLLLAAASLCKPNVAAVPAMLFVIDRVWLGRPTRAVLAAVWPQVIVAVATLVLMKQLQATSATTDVALWRRPFVAGDALAFYLGRFAWPFDLSADYSRTPELAAKSSWFWAAWIVPTLIAVILLRWRNRGALTAAGLFFIALLPVSGLVPFEFQRISTVADRYAYLALLGPAFGIAAFLVSVPARRLRFSLSLAVAVLCLLGWRSFDQTKTWRDDDALWEHAIAVIPDARVGMSNVADALRRRGDREGARQLSEKIIARSPHDERGLYGLAMLAADANDFATAYAIYEKAAALNPDDQTIVSASHDSAAWMAMRQGKRDDAERLYRAAIDAAPDDGNAHNDLGALLLERGAFEEAAKHFDAALAASPRHALALLNRAYAFDKLGDSADAEKALHHAVELLPRDSTPRKRLGKRAMAARNWPAAIEWYTKALALDASDVDTLNELGQCQAISGDVDAAIATFERAISLAPTLKILQENLESAKTLKAKKSS